jgi:hypothetical protein
MRAALASPALQVLCAAFALFLFTWPFLVFERPVHVFVYFGCAWVAVIGLLFAFSGAREGDRFGADADDDGLDDEANDA